MSHRLDSDEGNDKAGDLGGYKDSMDKDSRFTKVVDSKFDDHHQQKDDRLLATIKYDFKIILVGDTAVGKTCLFTRFANNEFRPNPETSMSLVSAEKKLNLDQSTVANLQIWDTCGEEKFRALGRAYFKSCHGAIIVFDVTQRESFESLDRWIDDVKMNAPEDVLLIIVGNKADDSTNRKVTFKEANSYAANKKIDYYDVSAKTGNNVALSFEMLTNKVQTRFEEGGFKTMGKPGASLKPDIVKAIQDTDPKPKSSGCPC